MYAIYADRVCIYNDTDPSPELKVVNPELTLADNSAGSLTVTLPPTNIGYSIVERMVTDISVRKDGSEIWAGRVLSESKDFWNNRVLYCEGELAFFNDSVQPPEQYTIDSYNKLITTLGKIITNHNNQVTNDRQFVLSGVAGINAESVNQTFDTNYDVTMASINSFIEAFGGHIYVYKDNGVRRFELVRYSNESSQAIEFGVNLLDFTRSWDMTDFATVVIPLGARVNNSKSATGLDEYVTINETDNDPNYVQSEDDVINTYGRITKVIHFDDVSDPNVLIEKAEQYLRETQFDKMVIEMSALDLHYLNPNITDVKLLDRIRVVSKPHGLNRLFPVTELKIPLDSPEKATFKLGGEVTTNLTAVHNSANQKILTKIEKIPNSVLTEARRNATSLINNAGSGFITFRWHDEDAPSDSATKYSPGTEFIDVDNSKSDAIYISEAPWSDEIGDDGQIIGPGERYWIWNMGGFAYMDKSGGTDSPYYYYDTESRTGEYLYKVAITMDGSIVADFITAGVMMADRIQAGILQDIGNNANPTDLLSRHGSTVNSTSNHVTYSGLGTYTVSGKASAASSCQLAIIPASTGSVGSETVNFTTGDKLGIYIKSTEQNNSKHIKVKATWERKVGSDSPIVGDSISATDSYTLTVPSHITAQNSNPPTRLVVKLEVPSGESVQGTITVQVINISNDHNVIFDLTSGSLTMKHGFIGLGEIMTTQDPLDPRNGHYKFEVDEDGNLIAGTGVFAGQLVAASGSFYGIVQAQDFYDWTGASILRYINNNGETTPSIDNAVTYKFQEGILDLPTYTIGVSGATITFQRSGYNSDGTTYTTDMFSNQSSITLSADNIVIDGVATFLSSLLSEENRTVDGETVSTTVIDGGMIKTGTIEGDRFVANVEISAPRITGGYINGSTIYGSTIFWGDGQTAIGSLFRTQGSSDGHTTEIIELLSSDGLVLQAADGGLRLEASGGIWINADITNIHMKKDNPLEYSSLADLLIATFG